MLSLVLMMNYFLHCKSNKKYSVSLHRFYIFKKQTHNEEDFFICLDCRSSGVLHP